MEKLRQSWVSSGYASKWKTNRIAINDIIKSDSQQNTFREVRNSCLELPLSFFSMAELSLHGWASPILSALQAHLYQRINSSPESLDPGRGCLGVIYLLAVLKDTMFLLWQFSLLFSRTWCLCLGLFYLPCHRVRRPTPCTDKGP